MPISIPFGPNNFNISAGNFTFQGCIKIDGTASPYNLHIGDRGQTSCANTTPRQVGTIGIDANGTITSVSFGNHQVGGQTITGMSGTFNGQTGGGAITTAAQDPDDTEGSWDAGGSEGGY
jgi:hypothetical protein